MAPPDDIALPEKVLLAAANLEEAGQSPFSAEALIVAAWQLYPRTFGLKGYEDQYPDSNKVLSSIMGSRGLPQRGWLAKVGQKLYSLTHEGRTVVARLRDQEAAPPVLSSPRAGRLAREQDLLLQALLASAAWQKCRSGRKADWTFSEAVKFWDLGERNGDQVEAHLRQRKADLVAIEKALAAGSATLGNGLRVSAVEAGALLEVHEQLESRFARHLNLLRSRGRA